MANNSDFSPVKAEAASSSDFCNTITPINKTEISKQETEETSESAVSSKTEEASESAVDSESETVSDSSSAESEVNNDAEASTEIDPEYSEFASAMESRSTSMYNSTVATFGEEDASLLKTMLLGDRSELDTNTKIMFQRCGIAHILAISGLHVALIARVFETFIALLGVRKRPASIIVIIFVVAYGIMTGMSAEKGEARSFFSIVMPSSPGSIISSIISCGGSFLEGCRICQPV